MVIKKGEVARLNLFREFVHDLFSLWSQLQILLNFIYILSEPESITERNGALEHTYKSKYNKKANVRNYYDPYINKLVIAILK